MAINVFLYLLFLPDIGDNVDRFEVLAISQQIDISELWTTYYELHHNEVNLYHMRENFIADLKRQYDAIELTYETTVLDRP